MPRKRIGSEKVIYNANQLIYLLDCQLQRTTNSYVNNNPGGANEKKVKREAAVMHRMVDEFLNTGKATKYEGVYY